MVSKSSAGVVVGLFIALSLPGCGGSDDSGPRGSSGGGLGSSRLSGVQREAAAAAMAEISKHWAKGPDGWTMASWEGTSFAPIKYLAQFKELGVDEVEPFDLNESDKMNGFEWAGSVSFKNAPYREVGEPGLIMGGMTGNAAQRQRGAWSQWFDRTPEPIQVAKVKGKWQLNRQDYWMMSGTLPTAADYQNAGMKK